MLAVSFEPYAPETLEVVDAALARGARLLALTDSQLSPWHPAPPSPCWPRTQPPSAFAP